MNDPVRLALVFVACALAGCGDSESSAPAAPAEPAEPVVTAPEPDLAQSSSAPTERASASAIAAYRALLAAYAAGDAETFAAAYAPRLRCYVRRADVDGLHVQQRHVTRLARNRQAASEAERARRRSLSLTVEMEMGNEVVLHDWGWEGRGGSVEDTRLYADRVTLERREGVWLVVAESPLGAGCGEVPPREAPPAIWTAVDDGYRALLAACTGESAPGIGATDACRCDAHVPTADAYCRSTLGCGEGCDAARLATCVEGDEAAELRIFCSPGEG